MSVVSDGCYGIQQGFVFSVPVTCKNGDYEIVKGLTLSERVKEGIAQACKDLIVEKSRSDHYLGLL